MQREKENGISQMSFCKTIWWAAQNVTSVRLTDSCLWMAFCLAWHPGMPPSTKARRREVWAFRCGFVAVLTACRVLSDKVRRIVATRGARILTWRGGVAYICRICSQECKGPWFRPWTHEDTAAPLAERSEMMEAHRIHLMGRQGQLA